MILPGEWGRGRIGSYTKVWWGGGNERILRRNNAESEAKWGKTPLKEKTNDRKWRNRSGNRRKEGRKTWAGSIRKAEKRGKRFAQSGAQWGEQANKTVAICTELNASGERVHKENG